jgi:hypothetical protein
MSASKPSSTREIAFSAHSLADYPSGAELTEAMAQAQASCPNGPDPETGEYPCDGYPGPCVVCGWEPSDA